MKPQALQEAIKAAAAKKRNCREASGWKDPQVKVHKITAEEYANIKKRQTPEVGSTSITASVTMSNNQVDLIQQQLKAVREELLAVVKRHEEEIKEQKTEIEWLRNITKQNGQNNTKVNGKSHSHNNADSQLQEQVKLLKQAMDLMKNEMAEMKKEMARLREENKVHRGENGNNKSTPNGQSTKKASTQPHTAQELSEYQRKDKKLRDYMQAQEGLFSAKYMSVDVSSDGHKLVLFKKRVYIPSKLRSKTLEWYFNNVSEDPEMALRKNCIWVDMDQDITEFRAKNH